MLILDPFETRGLPAATNDIKTFGAVMFDEAFPNPFSCSGNQNDPTVPVNLSAP